MRLRSSHLAVLISAVVLLASCGSGAKSGSDANTGGIAFSLKWPGSANVSSKPSTGEDQASQAVDCPGTGIDTIYAEVWDGNTGQSLNVSATFLCTAGQGTLTGVAAGTNRLVRMFGKDLSGTILYRGTQTGITVTAGATAAAGTIKMSSLSSEISSIAITPADPSITVAGTQQMTATATYSDASTGDITSSVTWNSTEKGVATVTAGGLVTGVSAGQTIVTATSGTVFTSTTVTVTAGTVTLTSITLSPSTASLTSIGATQQLTATAAYDDTSTPDVTSSVTWSSSADSVASVSSSGLVTAIGSGSATVTAVLGGVTSNSVAVTVSASATLSSIAVTLPTAPIDEGATYAFTATGTYDDSTTQNLTSSVTWTSSVATVATIANTGIATGTGLGSIPDPADPTATISTNDTTITATIGSVTPATATLSVRPLPLAPTNVTAAAGDNQATVTWDTVTGATSYNIYWSTTSGVTISNGTKIAGAASGDIYPGLTGGTTYYYIVTAVSDGSVLSDTVNYSIGEGPASSEASVTPTDANAPAVSGTTPTNDTTPTWSWTTAGGAGYYRYKLDDNDLTVGAAKGTGTTYTPSAQTEGSHTLYVQENSVSDGSGSWSPTGSLTLTIDTTAPTAPSVSGTTPTNDTTPTWEWSPGGGGNGSYQYQLDAETAGAWAATPATTYTYSGTPFGDTETHTLYVQESDDAGNWSTSGSFTITIDTTAPAAPSITSPSDGAVTNDTTPTVSGTAEADSTVELFDTDGTTSLGTATATGGSWTMTSAALSDGAHSLTAKAADAAGNTGTASTPVGVTIDTTAPSTPGTPTDAGTYSSSTTVTFNWTAATDAGSGIADYVLSVNTQSNFLGTNRFSGSVGNVTTYAAPGGVDGDTLYARVQAVDAAGNTGSVSVVSDGITIDTSGPGTAGTPTDAGTYSTSTTVTFNWTAATDAESGIVSYNVQVGTTAGGNDIYDGSVGTTTYNATGTSGQTLYARVQAVNGAGSTGSWSGVSDGIIIDTTAPGIPGTPTDAGTVTNIVTVSFDWTAATEDVSGIASYNLQVGTSAGASDVFNANVGNVLTYSVVGTDGDTLYARVQAVNGAGTAGSWTTASGGILISVSADVTAPSVSSTSPASSAVGVPLDSTISVTFDEPMDTATITTSTFTVNDGSSNILGVITFSNANRTATFTPTSNLVSNDVTATTYTVTILGNGSSGVADTAVIPNYLATNYTWSFTAGSSNWGEMIWGEDEWGL